MIYFVFFLLGMLVLGMVIVVSMEVIKHAKRKQATMPSANVKRQLRDLEVGETVVVSSVCFAVDNKHRCWINPEESLDGPSAYSSNGRLQVTRTSTGYEAVLLDPNTKFKPREWFYSYAPVEKFEIVKEKI